MCGRGKDRTNNQSARAAGSFGPSGESDIDGCGTARFGPARMEALRKFQPDDNASEKSETATRLGEKTVTEHEVRIR